MYHGELEALQGVKGIGEDMQVVSHLSTMPCPLLCRVTKLMEKAKTHRAKAKGRLCNVTGELEALQGVMGSGEDGQVVSRLVSKVATLEAAAGQAEAQRRSLHNQLVELRGNVSTSPCLQCSCQHIVLVNKENRGHQQKASQRPLGTWF